MSPLIQMSTERLADPEVYRCDEEPAITSYRQAHAIAFAHMRILDHSPTCKAELAAGAYLSSGLEEE
jgi:hypothetical protein